MAARRCSDRENAAMVKTRYGLEIRSATGADAVGISELLSAAGHAIAPRAIAS